MGTELQTYDGGGFFCGNMGQTEQTTHRVL